MITAKGYQSRMLVPIECEMRSTWPVLSRHAALDLARDQGVVCGLHLVNSHHIVRVRHRKPGSLRTKCHPTYITAVQDRSALLDGTHTAPGQRPAVQPLPARPRADPKRPEPRAGAVRRRRIERHAQQPDVERNAAILEASCVWDVREAEGAGVPDVGLRAVLLRPGLVRDVDTVLHEALLPKRSLL
ncbi:unnamed protein product [Mycena citricolor]|uniref:Uncharacterized protein n=1 Tax=Mycena citricolor TaxID=2018698 RepID=A0AAD2K5V3_9AGAR|nr:unnamed protein product [Mycena citricolor]